TGRQAGSVGHSVSASPARAAAQPVRPVSRVSGELARRPAWIRWQYYAWGGVVTLNVVIWLLVSILARELIYPWPLWVAGPSGVPLVAQDAGPGVGPGPRH